MDKNGATATAIAKLKDAHIQALSELNQGNNLNPDTVQAMLHAMEVATNQLQRINKALAGMEAM